MIGLTRVYIPQPLSRHRLSFSALTTLLLSLQLSVRIGETQSRDVSESSSDPTDLTYTDSSHGPQTAAAHQQVLYIDHGGGAISHIRRTSFLPNPSVPSLPFRPHVPHFPNHIFENNLREDPYVNFPEDIPRIDRRNGPPQQQSPIGAQPAVPFVPHNVAQPMPPLQPSPQPVHPVHHHSIQQSPQAIAQPIPQAFQQPFPQQPQLHQTLPQPLPQPLSQPFPQPLPQPLAQPFPHHIPQPLSYPQPVVHSIPQPIPQPIQHPNHQPFTQPLVQPLRSPMAPNHVLKPLRHPIDDIEDERFLINNEIERIPKPSNRKKPARREPPAQDPPPPPPPPADEQPFFNFDGPELFGGLDGPFDFFGPQSNPLFQRRRLTTNNNVPDVNQNSIGHSSLSHFQGEDSPSITHWPKIFKFTDGRSNLYEFEKQKKQNKIKFSSKETYFDHISRDSFLILHGGTYAQ